MSDLLARIRAAQVQAAEEAVIASIPADLKEHMRKADEAFKARGGCKGCGSMVLAVHRGGCPTLREPDFY
jgi:hypothetical protein